MIEDMVDWEERGEDEEPALDLEELREELHSLTQARDTIKVLVEEQIKVRQVMELAQDIKSIADIFMLMRNKYERRGLMTIQGTLDSRITDIEEDIKEIANATE